MISATQRNRITDHGTGEEMAAQQGEEGPVTKKPLVEDEDEMVAQQAEEGPVTKKPHVEDVDDQDEDEDEEEEEKGLTNLKSFRKNWLKVMSRFVGPLEAISKFSCSLSRHNMIQIDLQSSIWSYGVAC
jgi:hypothetical protein